MRARSLSLYGYQRVTTPNLDKLAQRAVVFDSAVTAASWTLPAHASLFTGRYPHEHSADRESPLDRALPTLAEVFGRIGYQTGGFVANTHWVGVASDSIAGFRGMRMSCTSPRRRSWARGGSRERCSLDCGVSRAATNPMTPSRRASGGPS